MKKKSEKIRQPIVSFCVISYNHENTIKETLDSILKQKTFYNYEIIVSDDGSSDNTANIIKEYITKHPNIINFYQMPRDESLAYSPYKRISNNNINALMHATGEYIIFIDGDDYFCNDNFIDQAIELINKKNLIGVVHKFKRIFPDSKEDIPSNYKAGVINASRYIKYDYIHSGTILFKNIFNKNILDYLKSTNDFDDNLITMYLLSKGKLYYEPTLIYAYRQSQRGIWCGKNEIEQAFDNIEETIVLQSLLPKYKNQLNIRSFYSLQTIYRHKDVLENYLNKEQYSKYMQQFKANKFINGCFLWRQLNKWQKLQIKIYYNIFRVFIKYDKIFRFI